MKKNMGSIDKIFRTTIAIIVAVLYYSDVINGTMAQILLAFAIVLLITSFLSFCPFYTLIGLNTNKKT